MTFISGGEPQVAVNVLYRDIGGGQYAPAVPTNVGGPLRIGASANAQNALGVTVQQGAADDEIASWKSSDVAHGMTTVTETDTFGLLKKASANNGGAWLHGLSEVSIGLQLQGTHTTDDTTKTTGSVGAVYLASALKSGTTTAATGATGNMAVIASGGLAQFIFQGDGSAFENVGTAWTNYDDHDDVALLTEISRAVSRPDDPIHAAFRDWAEADRDRIQALDLVHFNPDGHHFANRSKIQMLLIGAVRQLGQRLAAQDAELAALKTALALPGA